MHSILDRYRLLALSIQDCVRWSCSLEAVAPKLGNVHPSAHFNDLSLNHFILAADALAKSCQEHNSVGEIVLAAVEEAVESCSTNVNLGIALLVAPLVVARKLQTPVAHVLSNLTEEEAHRVYAAILRANPGGLGEVDELDVRQAAPKNLLAAMQLAEQRDLIARQYTYNFTDLLHFVVPRLEESIDKCGDVLWGVRGAQIEILARYGDSLVSRKCGAEVNQELKNRASHILSISNVDQRERAEQEFDQWLRADGHRRNPGTTADMIAAGLFVLLDS